MHLSVCIVQHYGKKSVMTVGIPVAVLALQSKNEELTRNTSSYLSLAAIHNARLLSHYAVQIIYSIVAGKWSLHGTLLQDEVISFLKKSVQKYVHIYVMCVALFLFSSSDYSTKFLLHHTEGKSNFYCISVESIYRRYIVE